MTNESIDQRSPAQLPVTDAAYAEFNAERTMDTAREQWRAAWWATTWALARPESTEETAEALAEAGRILGHSRRYLGERRMLARLLRHHYVYQQVKELPPRLALLYVVQAKADVRETLPALESAMRRQVSLRDFAQELGMRTPSWMSQAQRDADQAAAIDAAVDAAMEDAVRRHGSGSHHHRTVTIPPSSSVRPAVRELMNALLNVRHAAGKLADAGLLTTEEIAVLSEQARRAMPAVQWAAQLTPDQAAVSEQTAVFLRNLPAA